jgi:hypothetical protein
VELFCLQVSEQLALFFVGMILDIAHGWYFEASLGCCMVALMNVLHVKTKFAMVSNDLGIDRTARRLAVQQNKCLPIILTCSHCIETVILSSLHSINDVLLIFWSFHTSCIGRKCGRILHPC